MNNKEALSNRRQVAKNIKKQIDNGELINKEKAVLDAGYTKSTARSRTGDIVKSKQCQEELANIVEGLEEIRALDIKELLDPKLRKKMTQRDRIASIDVSTKNIQLISGKNTANESISVSWDND